MTTGPAFLFVLILFIWAVRRYGRQHVVAKTAAVSFLFIITEVLVGAGLVLTGNTAEALTAARPFWAIGHLINTFVLLAFLTLTAWFASGRIGFRYRSEGIVADRLGGRRNPSGRHERVGCRA
jgi:heme A synthase